jgi:hypothetical protein
LHYDPYQYYVIEHTNKKALSLLLIYQISL